LKHGAFEAGVAFWGRVRTGRTRHRLVGRIRRL